MVLARVITLPAAGGFAAWPHLLLTIRLTFVSLPDGISPGGPPHNTYRHISYAFMYQYRLVLIATPHTKEPCPAHASSLAICVHSAFVHPVGGLSRIVHSHPAQADNLPFRNRPTRMPMPSRWNISGYASGRNIA